MNMDTDKKEYIAAGAIGLMILGKYVVTPAVKKIRENGRKKKWQKAVKEAKEKVLGERTLKEA